MLSVIMLIVIMLSVTINSIMLNVIMLNVLAPFYCAESYQHFHGIQEMTLSRTTFSIMTLRTTEGLEIIYFLSQSVTCRSIKCCGAYFTEWK
jgi:hypothetical protein